MEVVGVISLPQVGAIGIAAQPGDLPVADGIKPVCELLAGHGLIVAPILFAGSHLPKRVIPERPAGTVHVRHRRALIGRVVSVGVGVEDGGLLGVERFNLPQAVQVIVGAARGHHVRAPVRRREAVPAFNSIGNMGALVGAWGSLSIGMPHKSQHPIDPCWHALFIGTRRQFTSNSPFTRILLNCLKKQRKRPLLIKRPLH